MVGSQRRAQLGLVPVGGRERDRGRRPVHKGLGGQQLSQQVGRLWELPGALRRRLAPGGDIFKAALENVFVFQGSALQFFRQLPQRAVLQSLYRPGGLIQPAGTIFQVVAFHKAQLNDRALLIREAGDERLHALHL